MPATDSTVPDDWLAQADLDLQAAEFLLGHQGLNSIVAIHLQQAAEKYLKGYLLSTGWRLRRIHDLGVLVKESVARDAGFEQFVAPCQRITEYYLEMRYPTMIRAPIETDCLSADLEIVRSLAQLIRSRLAQGGAGH